MCVCVCMCGGVSLIVLLICAAQCSNLPPLSQQKFQSLRICSIKYANLFSALCTLLEVSHLEPSPSPSPSLSRILWPTHLVPLQTHSICSHGLCTNTLGSQWESASLFAPAGGTHPFCPFGSAACSQNKLLVEEEGSLLENSLCLLAIRESTDRLGYTGCPYPSSSVFLEFVSCRVASASYDIMWKRCPRSCRYRYTARGGRALILLLHSCSSSFLLLKLYFSDYCIRMNPTTYCEKLVSPFFRPLFLSLSLFF